MILFTGGGTGGHLAIIDAVAEHIDGGVYVGSQKGQDRQWFESDPRFSEKYFLDTTGIVDKRGLDKGKALWKLIKAFFRSLGLVRKASCVFSVGGFSAAPAALAAVVLGKPLVIHEQNARQGRLNRLLRPFAAEFIESFGPKAHPYPVKKRFFQSARRRSELQTVIFLGGSQGARGINSFALEVAKRYDFTIIHQCGQRDYEWLKTEYAKLGKEDVELFAFSDALEQKMQRADFAVARAGASTLWELAANALPALFIPFPYAAGDHQYYNALFLRQKGAAWIMRQDALDVDFFAALTKEDIERASAELDSCIAPEGAEKIASLLLRRDGN